MKKAMTDDEKLLAQFNGVAEAIVVHLNSDWGKLKEPVLFVSSHGKSIRIGIREAADVKETTHAKAYPATYFYDVDEDSGEMYIDEKKLYNVAAEWVFIRANSKNVSTK